MRPDKARRRRRVLLAIAQKRLRVPTKGSRHLAELAMQAARQHMPCAHQVRHNTMEQAATVAIRQIEAGRAKSLSPYKCPHCHGWHLTRKSQGRRMPRFVAKPEPGTNEETTP